LVIDINIENYGYIFRFTEPSSGQIHSSTFSECAHYRIPNCLQIILTLKIIFNIHGSVHRSMTQ